jgi:hypothetical protein
LKEILREVYTVFLRSLAPAFGRLALTLLVTGTIRLSIGISGREDKAFDTEYVGSVRKGESGTEAEEAETERTRAPFDWT